MRLFFKIIVLCCVFLSTCNTFAAVAPSISEATPAGVSNAIGQTDAGRIGQQLQQQLHAVPKTGPSPQVTPHKTNMPTNGDKIKFRLMKVIIKGNTVLNKNEFGKIFKPSIHQMISLTDLENMVHEVTAKYREAGFILTRAILPPQTIRDGIVQVQIVEGYISGVSVKGDTGSLDALLTSYGKIIMESRPLQIHVLERYALLANDLPGVTVQTVIQPSKQIPAGADLMLVVAQRRRISGYYAYDDYGTRYIGPNENTLGVSTYSFFVPGDSNNFRASRTTQPQELSFLELTHTQPVWVPGMKWTLGIDYTQTLPGFILQPLQINGENVLVFTDLTFPILRSRNKNLSIHSTFNYQNVTTTILAFPFYQDRIRSLDLGSNMDFTDKWLGSNAYSLDMIHGFPIWGAHDHDLQSRPEGQAGYTRFTAAASRLQGLMGKFSIFAQVRGQYSFQPLLATEQYGVGGPDIGRGYDPSEIVGDKGISGKVELRYDAFPGLTFLQSVEYYLFYDAGQIWNLDNFDLPDKQSLTSTGLGARFNILPQVSGNFFIARPLTKPVATMVALGHNPNQVRMFFQFIASV